MTETLISVAALGVASLALLVAVLGRRRQRGERELIEFLGKQHEDLETALGECRSGFDADRLTLEDHARKIAWLEAKARRPQFAAEAALEKTLTAAAAAAEPEKLNIGERRHRVLRLAAQGEDPSAIAARLGMMNGEVELIIKLNK